MIVLRAPSSARGKGSKRHLMPKLLISIKKRNRQEIKENEEILEKRDINFKKIYNLFHFYFKIMNIFDECILG
jgi:hypothetical protein